MRLRRWRRRVGMAIAFVVMLLALATFRRATMLPDPPTLRVGMTWQEATAEIHNDFRSGGGPAGGWALWYSVGPNVWGEVLSVSVFFDREYRVTGWSSQKSVHTNRPNPGPAWFDAIRRRLGF
jgi:hypothetical protein